MGSERHGPLEGLDPEAAARAVEDYRASLFRPNPLAPERGLDYALASEVPQTLQFLIECLPTLQELIAAYPRETVLRFLDFGPGMGAAADLMARLHGSGFLGPRLEVEALDRIDRRRDLARFSYPAVRYRVGDIFRMPAEESWDIIYCSNVIEHLEDPTALIRALQSRARGWLLLYAPLEEDPLSIGHKFRVTEAWLRTFGPERIEIRRSLAWQPPHLQDPLQIMALLRGKAGHE